MRVLMTGGGTAGHVNPALAIADIIMQKEPDSVIEYVGTEKGIEGRLVPKKGMRLHPIKVQGLSRSLSPANIKAFVLAMDARKQCKKLIREFCPDVVIGTGGYVCWPLISAASALKIPAVLHESNAEPGFAVKTLRNHAKLILINFEGTRKYLEGAKATVQRVGMPVNKEFLALTQKKHMPHIAEPSSCSDNVDKMSCDASKTPAEHEERVKRILSFGGSLGAHTVNMSVLKLMKEYIALNPTVRIEHSCGTREYEEVKKSFMDLGLDACKNIVLSEYIYDMPKKMCEADLVICRSGASTLAELAVAGKAAVLIPSPNVTGDQQRKNAAQLSQKGAAVVLEDSLAVDEIVETVSRLLSDDNKLADLAHRVKEFAITDCDDKIYGAIKDLVEKK